MQELPVSFRADGEADLTEKKISEKPSGLDKVQKPEETLSQQNQRGQELLIKVQKHKIHENHSKKKRSNFRTDRLDLSNSTKLKENQVQDQVLQNFQHLRVPCDPQKRQQHLRNAPA